MCLVENFVPSFVMIDVCLSHKVLIEGAPCPILIRGFLVNKSLHGGQEGLQELKEDLLDLHH